MQAIWYPMWFGLDTPLEVGQTDTFELVRQPVEIGCQPGAWMIWSPMFRGIDPMRIRAKLLSLKNETLGWINKIDTTGPYMFTLLDGSNVAVDEEESPGWVIDRVRIGDKLQHITVQDWSVLVELEPLSEPVPARSP